MPNEMKMDWNKGCFVPVVYPELKRGQIIHSYSGMCGSCHQKSVLISVKKDEWGTHYRAVDLETFEYTYPHAPEPLSERKSLGSFFEEGAILPEEDVADAENRARLRQAMENRKTEALRLERERQKEVGKQRFVEAIRKHGFPKALLIAELRRDESDITTDYWGSTTTREIVLAFSKHQRNNFREFRKAAQNAEEPGIRELATAPADWEHRENYSMGGGYYLGQHRHSGWQISKHAIDKEEHLERFYSIAGEDGGFQVK